MSSSVHVIPELPVVLMRLTGRAHIRALRSMIADAYALPNYEAGMTEICDLSQVLDLDIGFDEMLRFAQESKTVHDARGISPELFVIAPTDAAHYMLDMFEQLSGSLGNSLRIHLARGYPEIFAMMDWPETAMRHLPEYCRVECHLFQESKPL